nr:accessory subunit of RNA polymerase [Saccharomycopsis selenospora]
MLKHNLVKMKQDLVDNLNYFSNITQQTLSAFHISGLDNDLYKDIEELKRSVNNSNQKTLKTVKFNSKTNKYIRYFEDDSTDEVEEDEVLDPVYYKESEISKKLSHKPSPIMSIKLSKLHVTKDNEINTCLEQMFFNKYKNTSNS